MPLASYTELTDEMAGWLNRADLTSKIPTFIRLFEARMNRRLRSPDMECIATQTTTAGIDTYALPSDFREMRLFYLGGTPRTYPTAMSPESLKSEFTGREGSPTSAYTIIGESIILAPTPTSATPLTMVYWQNLAGLDTGNPTNWLLNDHPDAYLFGSLARAEAYLKDDERVAFWKAAEDEAVSEIIRDGIKKRIPGGPLAVRPAVFE